mmetsp:Transcript_116873/g.277638  ORF Transcript_116873/g.277638 Transcript_116873/m.277638 type:complete len:516 (-) Transcript_116873:974-2521(-)
MASVAVDDLVALHVVARWELATIHLEAWRQLPTACLKVTEGLTTASVCNMIEGIMPCPRVDVMDRVVTVCTVIVSSSVVTASILVLVATILLLGFAPAQVAVRIILLAVVLVASTLLMRAAPCLLRLRPARFPADISCIAVEGGFVFASDLLLLAAPEFLRLRPLGLVLVDLKATIEGLASDVLVLAAVAFLHCRPALLPLGQPGITIEEIIDWRLVVFNTTDANLVAAVGLLAGFPGLQRVHVVVAVPLVAAHCVMVTAVVPLRRRPRLPAAACEGAVVVSMEDIVRGWLVMAMRIAAFALVTATPQRLVAGPKNVPVAVEVVAVVGIATDVLVITAPPLLSVAEEVLPAALFGPRAGPGVGSHFVVAAAEMSFAAPLPFLLVPFGLPVIVVLFAVMWRWRGMAHAALLLLDAAECALGFAPVLVEVVLVIVTVVRVASDFVVFATPELLLARPGFKGCFVAACFAGVGLARHALMCAAPVLLLLGPPLPGIVTCRAVVWAAQTLMLAAPSLLR